jgi:hypothetical protein
MEYLCHIVLGEGVKAELNKVEAMVK